MRRKNDRIWLTSRMMVSRTAIVLFVFYAIVHVCASEVQMKDSNKETIHGSTTPVIVRSSTMIPTPKSSRSSSTFSLNNMNGKKTGDKGTPLRTGNELWDGIIGQCYKKPSFSCFQKNVFTYLDTTLDVADVNVTSGIKFLKNHVEYKRHDQNLDGLAKEEHEEARSDSPIEEVTTALHGKSMKFLMTHDIELKLPEMMFDGATFRLSPRSIEGNGAIVKLEFIPNTHLQHQETGRIFKKKIFNIFKNKLLLSFLALVLVIKLIKIKLFWLLPVLVGVTAAKKLVLKFMLFLFPALAHIFKLCSYYHANYHQTKYHTHHHHINHHHTQIVPPWHNDHEHHAPPIHQGPELIYTSPPKSPPLEIIHDSPPSFASYPTGWESSGPGLGSEYISDVHRNSHVESPFFKPKLDDANEINSWGLGTTPSASHSFNLNPFLPELPGSINKNSKQFSPGPVYVGPQKNALATAQYQPNLTHQTLVKDIHRTQAQVKEALRIQAEKKLVEHQQKILLQQPFVQDGQPLMPKGYDPFYTPLLSKMDKIFFQLGFTDDSCKERLVCSMYKNPSRYSPHSNFISAELSRETNELDKPTISNISSERFHRLVQAARNGQDQNDCLLLHPNCSIKTE